MSGLATSTRLRELKKTGDDGILTQEEFDAQKAKALASRGTYEASAAKTVPSPAANSIAAKAT